MEPYTLEQMYFLVQIFAGIAVVVSLIYVGLQVKQNTQALRLNAQHEASSDFIQLQYVLAQNGELMEIVMRSETEPESLNDLERRRAWVLVDSMFELVNTNFYQSQTRVLPDYQWNPIVRDFRQIVTLPIYQEVWSARKHAYSDEFQTFIDQLIKKGATSWNH
jgi:hypothetical protein